MSTKQAIDNVDDPDSDGAAAMNFITKAFGTIEFCTLGTPVEGEHLSGPISRDTAILSLRYPISRDTFQGKSALPQNGAIPPFGT